MNRGHFRRVTRSMKSTGTSRGMRDTRGTEVDGHVGIEQLGAIKPHAAVDVATPELVWQDTILLHQARRRMDVRTSSVLTQVVRPFPPWEEAWGINPNGAFKRLSLLVWCAKIATSLLLYTRA